MKFLANRKSRLLKPASMLLFAAVMILFAVFMLLVREVRFIYLRTEQALEKARQNQSKQNAVSFSRVPLTPHLNQNISIIQTTRNVRSVAEFQDSLFAATDGGLLQMTGDGELRRHFTVLDGLPESDLTALAVFGGRLFIGTKASGLLQFDGEKFERFRFEDHETKSITALFPDSQALLVGTLAGGLLVFDGLNFRELKAVDERIEHITFLSRDDSRLIVGTFGGGLWIFRNQVWKRFTIADGLFSNRVTGAEILDGELFAATDLGVSQIRVEEISPENQTAFRKLIALPTLAGLIAEHGKIYLAKDNGEIYCFPARREPAGEILLKRIDWQTPDGLQSAGFARTAGAVWLLGSQGVWKSGGPQADELTFARPNRPEHENELADNNVSALAVDERERLWVGTFRRGLDVFSADGKKLAHLESETVREINSLSRTAEKKEMLAATAGGAVRFGGDFGENPYVENSRLPSRSVAQIAEVKAEETRLAVISTAKGLVVDDKQERRLYSTVNGLPANSISATLFARDALFVGTTGGLAQIEKGRVARVFKTSNSALGHNWITALAAAAGDRIFIGTYGGGIFELLPSGEVRGFAGEAGRFFVNPNALYADGERLFAGTLDGVRCLDLTTQKWSRISDILPSATVLSIGGDRRGNVYFGTTGGIARVGPGFWTETKL